MKVLFLIFHSLYTANGISKKIRYQVDALNSCGAKAELCYIFEEDGLKQRRVDNKVICDYGSGIKGKILKRIEFTSISNYVIQNNVQLVYIRSAHNAHPFTIQMVKRMHQSGAHIVFEIPTYPYDQEYDSLSKRMELLPDKLFRKQLMKYVDKVVTFSDFNEIFGVPTIRISNGIDFAQIKLKKNMPNIFQELHLIGVAEIHYWHGFDRIIKGLINYYKSNPTYNIYFHIVGEFFGNRERDEIIPLISNNHLEKYIILHGAKQGKELDELFEQASIGIGSLGRHRSGIHSIKTLKNREYAARGIPFIYSENDSDFEEMPYIIKAPEDESPIDIEHIVSLRKEIILSPINIRESIKHLSWKEQMQKVIDAVKENKK